jgi:hypothetical protein
LTNKKPVSCREIKSDYSDCSYVYIHRSAFIPHAMRIHIIGAKMLLTYQPIYKSKNIQSYEAEDRFLNYTTTFVCGAIFLTNQNL